MRENLINEFEVVIVNGDGIYESPNEKIDGFEETVLDNAHKLIYQRKMEKRISLLEAKLETVHDMLSILVESDGNGMIDFLK